MCVDKDLLLIFAIMRVKWDFIIRMFRAQRDNELPQLFSGISETKVSVAELDGRATSLIAVYTVYFYARLLFFGLIRRWKLWWKLTRSLFSFLYPIFLFIIYTYRVLNADICVNHAFCCLFSQFKEINVS